MEKLEDFGALLKELRTEARYRPIHELLYYVYRRSRYYDYVSAMPAGEIRRGNLDMLVEKAAAYEATSYKGLFHFVRYIERLKNTIRILEKLPWPARKKHGPHYEHP